MVLQALSADCPHCGETIHVVLQPLSEKDGVLDCREYLFSCKCGYWMVSLVPPHETYQLATYTEALRRDSLG